MSKRNTRSDRPTAAGQKILRGLIEIRDALASGDMSKLTIRTVQIPEPARYTAQEIRALRASLDVSQAVFAELVAVSPALVAQWESGIRQPAPIARRLLDKMREDPEAFLSSLIRRKTA